MTSRKKAASKFKWSRDIFDFEAKHLAIFFRATNVAVGNAAYETRKKPPRSQFCDLCALSKLSNQGLSAFFPKFFFFGELSRDRGRRRRHTYVLCPGCMYVCSATAVRILSAGFRNPAAYFFFAYARDYENALKMRKCSTHGRRRNFSRGGEFFLREGDYL